MHFNYLPRFDPAGGPQIIVQGNVKQVIEHGFDDNDRPVKVMILARF
jgi:hypothetical protein